MILKYWHPFSKIKPSQVPTNKTEKARNALQQPSNKYSVYKLTDTNHLPMFIKRLPIPTKLPEICPVAPNDLVTSVPDNLRSRYRVHHGG